MSFLTEMESRLNENHHVEVDNMILVNGDWYNVVDIQDDVVFATDDDGEEYEFNMSDIEAVE